MMILYVYTVVVVVVHDDFIFLHCGSSSCMILYFYTVVVVVVHDDFIFLHCGSSSCT